MMRTCYVLGVVVATLGCASSPGAKHSTPSLWPGGSEPQMRLFTGVKYGQPGKITVVTGSPRYAVFLELRPKLDSLDLRPSTNFDAGVPLPRSVDLYTSMETLDAIQ